MNYYGLNENTVGELVGVFEEQKILKGFFLGHRLLPLRM